MLRIAIILILGIIVGDAYGGSLNHLAGLVVAGCCLLMVAVVELMVGLSLPRLKCSNDVIPLLSSILIQFSFLFLGIFLIVNSKMSLERHFPSEEVVFDAVIISEPRGRGKVLQCDMLAIGNPNVNLRANILRDTLTHDYLQLHLGSGICAHSSVQSVSEIMPFPTMSSKRHFDYRRWLEVHGFSGQTFINYSDWDHKVVSMQSLSTFSRARLRLMKLRSKAVETLRESGLSGQEQAVVAAMVLGDKSAIADDTRDVYSITGASHVLALSGLHLGIVYWLLSFIFVRLRLQRLGQALTLPAIWLFALMVGFTPSVVRASVMFTIFGVVTMFRRHPFSLNTLSLAAIVMLAFNPLSLWDVGFQLSYMAVLGIICFYSPLSKSMMYVFRSWLPKCFSEINVLQMVVKWFVGMISVSFSAQLLTAPILAYYFGRFSTYFLLTNLIVIPIVTLILYLAALFFIIVILSNLTSISFFGLQTVVAQSISNLSFALNKMLEQVAKLPCSSVENLHLNEVQLILIYLLLIGFIALIMIVRRIVLYNRMISNR